MPTSTIPKTTLHYEWSLGKQGNIKELEEKAIVGPLTIEGHYDKRKNTTTITTKIKEKEHGDGDKEYEDTGSDRATNAEERGAENDRATKERLTGLRIITLTTNKGKIEVSY